MLLSFPAMAQTAPGDYSYAFEFGGHKRLYRVHVPASYAPDKPVALVFALHGGGGNMDLQANDAYYGQVAQAEKDGYVVVFPNGFSRLPGGKLATWNAGNCCGAARDKGSDDVGFVREVVRRLKLTLNVDSKRIYANGMSNGAMMAYRLACEAGDVFAAIAAVAGTDNTATCAPSGAVSVLHIHARDDDMVLFNGGAGRDRAAVTNFVAVPDSVAKWVRMNVCSVTPKRVLEVNGAYCDSYSPCKDGAEVKLCVTETGGHSWPGGTKVRGGAAGASSLSATGLIGEFFGTH
jgi:polyhydroxybutyrate depolymerase